MKTHSQENYHICPYPECGKRYAHEYKLRNHVMSQHEKNMLEVPKYIVPVPEQKPVKAPKASAGGAHSSPALERPNVCPYEGCEKAYIHKYKLNLHLRRAHPGHFEDETAKNAVSTAGNDADEAGSGDHDAYATTKRGNGKIRQRRNRAKPSIKLPPAKVARRKSSNANASPANISASRRSWLKKEAFEDDNDDDSEETEEEEEREDNGGWRYRPNEDDDEETEYED